MNLRSQLYRRRSTLHDHTYCKEVHLWSILSDHNYCCYFALERNIFAKNLIETKNLMLYKLACYSELDTYSCKNCKYKTYFVTSLMQHFADFHSSNFKNKNNLALEKIYTCIICGFETYSLLVWMKHKVKKCVKSILVCIYCCNRCDYFCDSVTELKAHQLYRHLTLILPCDKQYFCDMCTFTSVSESGLWKHKNVTHKVKRDRRLNWTKFGGNLPKLKMKSCLVKDPVASSVEWYKCANCNFKSHQPGKVKKHFCSKDTAF